jgi:integrase
VTAIPAFPGGRADQCIPSPFAGADVCEQAGFRLPDGAARPMFDHDVWDFAQVIGLPVLLAASARRLDFTVISSPPGRLVAKELMFALLVPRHDRVIVLPRALRTPLHIQTCNARLQETARLLNWLTGRGITRLPDVREEHCQEYLAHRSHRRAGDGTAAGLSMTSRHAAAQAIITLIDYRELFTADRVAADLRPWGGRCAAAVVGARGTWPANKTQPVPQPVLAPMLTAALYLTGTLGPHVAELARQARAARRATRQLPRPRLVPAGELTAVLGRHIRDRSPLPRLADHDIRQRLAAGWRADDPVLPVSLNLLAIQAGFQEFPHPCLEAIRRAIEDAVAAVGTQPWSGRTAPLVRAARGDGELPWTLPLHSHEVTALTEITRTAAVIVTAAVSGMRASELMELRTGCRLPIDSHGPGLDRYRLASTIVKGQPLGGTRDQWVVIEPVFTAVQIAEALHHNPRDGVLLFGRFQFGARYQSFRDWVNGPAGQRLGLAPIPPGAVNLRMLRRTLAIELAHRPGGILASKIHLKHVSVATTEGYAARPGGAQAQLLAEVNKHETERNLGLVLQEYRNYQAGILPAGPGASELTAFFARIDSPVPGPAGDDAGVQAPKVQRSDRDILNLLSRRAATLHLAAANYCWFTDPSRALCLKLAGTPDAKAPLAGLCDSARCPQATHHAVHRPVWAEHAENTKVFLGSLGPGRATEKARLRGDYDRAMRVIAGIDAAAGTPRPDPECG